MIMERCSCGSQFKSDEPNAVKLWREWRRKHACQESDLEIQATTSGLADTAIQPIGFAPFMELGRQDPALDE